MDFGAILDEWNRRTAKPQGKRGKIAEEAPVPDKGIDKPPGEEDHPLTVWLRLHEVYDKDAQDTEESPGQRRRRLMHKKPDATIDLHGLTQNEAWTALESFFQHSRREGFEKLLVIHGKGNHSSGEAVLKQTVKTFLERCSFAGERGPGNSASGGTGVTWVLLKAGGKKTRP